jgi:hypothetical protein
MAGGVFFLGNGIVDDFEIRKRTAGQEPEKAAFALYSSVQDEKVDRIPQISFPRLEAKTGKQLITMARRFVVERPFFMRASFSQVFAAFDF